MSTGKVAPRFLPTLTQVVHPMGKEPSHASVATPVPPVATRVPATASLAPKSDSMRADPDLDMDALVQRLLPLVLDQLFPVLESLVREQVSLAEADLRSELKTVVESTVASQLAKK